MFSKYNINGLTYMNNDGKNKNINPFDHSNYTDVMKTQALRDALDKYKFDFVYGEKWRKNFRRNFKRLGF